MTGFERILALRALIAAAMVDDFACVCSVGRVGSAEGLAQVVSALWWCGCGGRDVRLLALVSCSSPMPAGASE